MTCYWINAKQMTKETLLLLRNWSFIDKYSKKNLDITQFGCGINGIFGIHFKKDMKGKK